MPSYLHGSIEVRSRIIFYFIHTYRILPFYVWKIDLNIQRGRAKLSKEDRHGYKHTNIRTLGATKTKIAVLLTQVYLILIFKNSYEEKMVCKHTIFRDVVKKPFSYLTFFWPPCCNATLIDLFASIHMHFTK